MAKKDFQYGGWNSFILQCGTWLWDESRMTCHWIHPNVRHIGILLPVSISTISPQSVCHSAPVCEILSKSDRPRQKNDVMSIFQILDFWGLVIGSLKGPCTTSYRSSIDAIAVNSLVFEKIAYLHFGDRQTTNVQAHRIKLLSLSRAAAAAY